MITGQNLNESIPSSINHVFDHLDPTLAVSLFFFFTLSGLPELVVANNYIYPKNGRAKKTEGRAQMIMNRINRR